MLNIAEARMHASLRERRTWDLAQIDLRSSITVPFCGLAQAMIRRARDRAEQKLSGATVAGCKWGRLPVSPLHFQSVGGDDEKTAEQEVRSCDVLALARLPRRTLESSAPDPHRTGLWNIMGRDDFLVCRDKAPLEPAKGSSDLGPLAREDDLRRVRGEHRSFESTVAWKKKRKETRRRAKET